VRRTALILAALAALVLPTGALGAITTVTLSNGQKFKDYKTIVEARKDSDEPAATRVTLSITLTKASQSHVYTFQAASSALTIADNLSSGKIRLVAVPPSPRGFPRLAARALGAYGSGTIEFESTGATRHPDCPGGTVKTRPIARTSGGLTFSPTRNARNRYHRTAFAGSARYATGKPLCGPVATCDHFSSIQSSMFNSGTEESEFVSGVRRNMTSTGTTILFQYTPPSASVAPATSQLHVRTRKVAGARLTQASDLSSAGLDLNGVSGWSGSLAFSHTGGGATVDNDGCKIQSTFGATTGFIRTRMDFFGPVQHDGSPTSGATKKQPV
jgi:hypothetical protein